MKQTAVEWLISNLQQSKDWQRVLNEVSQMSTVQFNLLDQAKAIEKEQMMQCYEEGYNRVAKLIEDATQRKFNL